jgi:hypothetical protein
MEASALASQVDEIARSLAKNHEAVESSDKKAALAALVEFRRLEQLKAIAESMNNSTYFFGDKGKLCMTKRR